MNLKKELMYFLQSLDGDELRNLADGSLPEEMAVDAYIASCPAEKVERFEKVYVTTVEDLPKDEGYYFVMHIEDDGKDVYYFLPSEDDLISEWITKVEWWLRPVK